MRKLNPMLNEMPTEQIIGNFCCAILQDDNGTRLGEKGETLRIVDNQNLKFILYTVTRSHDGFLAIFNSKTKSLKKTLKKHFEQDELSIESLQKLQDIYKEETEKIDILRYQRRHFWNAVEDKLVFFDGLRIHDDMIIYVNTDLDNPNYFVPNSLHIQEDVITYMDKKGKTHCLYDGKTDKDEINSIIGKEKIQNQEMTDSIKK